MAKRRATLGEAMDRDERRRSSLSTMFEFRARSWLVRALLLALLGALAFAITWTVSK